MTIQPHNTDRSRLAGQAGKAARRQRMGRESSYPSRIHGVQRIASANLKG